MAKANRNKGNGRNAVSRAEARKVLDSSIMNLGEVRDLLEAMEQGDCGNATAESRAMFARCALVDAATKLEQALIDLGLLTKGEHDYRPGGWFVQEYPKAEVRQNALMGRAIGLDLKEHSPGEYADAPAPSDFSPSSTTRH